MNFECHITIALEHAAIGETAARGYGWKTSEIERDPLLGEASYFYLTKHSRDYIELFEDMRRVSHHLSINGAPVIREKIELIMYDTKTINRPAPTGVDANTGAVLY